jgi:hypothetical protein
LLDDRPPILHGLGGLETRLLEEIPAIPEDVRVDGLRDAIEHILPSGNIEGTREEIVPFRLRSSQHVIHRQEMTGASEFGNPVVVDVEDVVARILGNKEGAHLVMDRVAPDKFDFDRDASLLLVLLREDLLGDRAPCGR